MRRVALAAMLAGAGGAVLALAGAGSGAPAVSAQEVEVTLGKVRISGDGDFRPRRLFAHRRTPIRFVNVRGSLRNLDADDQEIPVPFPDPDPRQPIQAPAPEGSRPPIVSRLVIDFDRRGSVFTRGLPICRPHQVRNQTYAVAKRRCRDALIGEGIVNGVVDFPDQQPFVAPGNVLGFNGPPRRGRPTVVFHAWANPDVPTAFVVHAPIVPAPGKRFRHRLIVNIPRIANDNGAVTDGRAERIFKRWRWRGRMRSYLGARCTKPRRLVARVRVEFRPDRAFPQAHPSMTARASRPCRVRRGSAGAAAARRALVPGEFR